MPVTLVIGTRKGLFLARSEDRRAWTLDGPHIAGYEIQSAWLDPRDPRMGYAAAHHAVWGVHVYRTEDAGRSWSPLPEVPRHHDDEGPRSLRTLWCLAPGPDRAPETVYAGIEPPGLFVSHDRGDSWSRLSAFDQHPTASLWHPAKGGLAVHSVQGDGANPERLYAALCAGGCYRSDDAGASWIPINEGVRAPYLADPFPVAGHNEHRLLVHPRRGERLFRQSHTGTWISDDAGDRWREITAGLPSDFGYALATDADSPDTLFCIPEASTQMRYPVDGRLRVYRTEDAGEHWEALSAGLPQSHVYCTVLRDGMDSDHLDPLGLFFGTSSGHLFTSHDRGEHWHCQAEFLPPILSVKATVETA